MVERLDLYDKNRQKTGITICRGDAIPKGLYCRSVSVWVVNDNEEYLIAQRHPNKVYGGYWECPGGLLLSGENSLAGAVREIEEELGLRLNKAIGKRIYTTIREDWQDIYEIWFFRYDDHNPCLRLQRSEVTDAKWVTLEQLVTMRQSGELHPLIDYLDELPILIK